MIEAGLEHLLKRSCFKNKEGENLEKEADPLDFEIEEGGNNLSSGERQLICIVRAILRKNQIIIMDEATANIDLVTEKKIQKLINGQSRLRENLKSLGATDEEKRLRSRYVNQLDAEESKLAELNKAIKKVDEELTEANRYFHQKVNELTLEKVYE